MIPPSKDRCPSLVYCGCLQGGTTSQRRYGTLSEMTCDAQAMNTSYPWLLETAYGRTENRLDFLFLNHRLASLCRAHRPDIVWCDKATKIKRRTLRELKQQGATLVHVNPDDPFGMFSRGWSVFLDALQEYDVHFVPRAVNVGDYRRFGARCVYQYDRSFDHNLHRPLDGQPGRTPETDLQVGFVGSWAERRSDSLAYLLCHGVQVKIWGDGWRGKKNWALLQQGYRGPGAYGETYVERLNGLDIVLHFLREENRDEQDSRTYEIPGCGRFMLAERSAKHLELFQEGKEAEFFSTDAELLAKVRRYAANPVAVQEIARRGHSRSVNNYTHEHRLSAMLKIVVEERAWQARTKTQL